MNTRFHPGRLSAVAAGFVATATLAAALADPWTKAVTPPTGCYSEQDQFASKNEVAIESLRAETEGQEAVNQQIADQFTEQNNQDPMKMAAAMQEALMKAQDPMKYMQQMGATADPAALQAAGTQYTARQQQFKDEETALSRDYRRAYDKALAPARAKFAAYNAKVDTATGGQPNWTTENHAIQREADRAYEAMCAQWFGATGSMQAYLKKYKDYLVEERIPADEKPDAQRLTQYQMVGIAADAYRSTAKHKAVRDYMELADRLYGVRRAEPWCPGGTCQFAGAI